MRLSGVDSTPVLKQMASLCKSYQKE